MLCIERTTCWSCLCKIMLGRMIVKRNHQKNTPVTSHSSHSLHVYYTYMSVCVSVCVCVSMCLHASVCLCVPCVSMWPRVTVFSWVSMYLDVCVCLCSRVSVCPCMSVCCCVSMYLYGCMGGLHRCIVVCGKLSTVQVAELRHWSHH